MSRVRCVLPWILACGLFLLADAHHSAFLGAVSGAAFVWVIAREQDRRDRRAGLDRRA